MCRIALSLALAVPLFLQTGASFAQDGSKSLADAGLAIPPPPREMEARKSWLQDRLNDALATPALAKAKVAVAVMDSETGKLIYTRNEKALMNVASNVKLVTEAATLSALGPEFRFKTAVLAPIPPEGGKPIGTGGELRGDLFLRAMGDPSLDTEDLVSLANQLAAGGLRKVRGGLVIDSSAFDNTILPPAFEQKNESAAFRAPSSAASLESNVITLTLIPGATAGAKGRVIVDPPSPAILVTGSIVTSKEPSSLQVETGDGGEGRTIVTVSGRIQAGVEPRILTRRVWDPETFLGATFRQVLQKRGISVDKPTRSGAIPKDGMRTLAAHDSPTLAVIVHELGKRSSNFAAEQLLRTLGGETFGRPGTFPKGIDAVGKYLDGLGIAKTAYTMKNGSGLYDSNRFTAEQLATVIRAAMRDFRMGSEYLASLAVGGADGTLAHRMAGSPAERFVRAKTGTLATVSCLSGVAGAPGMKPLVFSILINEVASPTAARAVQDRITATLVVFLDPSLAK